MLEVFGTGLGLIAIVCTLLPILKNEAWWIRIFDFPRLQILFVLGIALTFQLVVSPAWQLYFIVPIAFCIIFQVIKIFPYTTLAQKQVLPSSRTGSEPTCLSIVFANVLMTNRNAAKCRDLLTSIDPDVILVVEADKWWEKELKQFETSHPYLLQAPLGNTYGMLLYSKLKLIQSEVRYLLKHDIPSMHCVIEMRSGDKVNFYGVHPRPPAPSESSTSVQRDAELVIVGKEAKRSHLPVIVAGDLNDVAWSHTTHLFQKISGLLDPRVGRGMFSTFNSKQFLFRWPLDHCFHSTDFKLLEIKRLSHIDSDHFPIYIKLSYEPEAAHQQQEKELTQDAVEEANEKVEKVKEE